MKKVLIALCAFTITLAAAKAQEINYASKWLSGTNTVEFTTGQWPQIKVNYVFGSFATTNDRIFTVLFTRPNTNAVDVSFGPILSDSNSAQTCYMSLPKAFILQAGDKLIVTNSSLTEHMEVIVGYER